MTTWDRYKQATTGLEVKSYLGDIFTIRSYCDDPQGGVFVAKEPACIFSAVPVAVFVGETVSWDISASSSSTGTIDTFDVDWGGSTSTGDLVAQDWAVDPKSGTTTYTAKGRFTIIASVTDTLGNKSKEVKIPITVMSSGMDEDDGNGYNSLQKVYIGTTDSGCFVLTPTAAAVASNTGLSGNDLKFRDMKVLPETLIDPNGNHHIWAATATGVAYSFDGAVTWSVIDKTALGDPVNTAADGTPPVTADLDQIGLCFDPRNTRRVFLLRTKSNRSWLYFTNDYGASWSNIQLSDGGGNAFDYEFDTDLEGWIIRPGEYGSVAWEGTDGNDAVGNMEGTTEQVPDSGALHHCNLEVTLAKPVIGIASLSLAMKSPTATAIQVYPRFAEGTAEVSTSPVSANATGAWVTHTFTTTRPGTFSKLILGCVDPTTGAPRTVRLDDVRLVVSFNFTHSAGGIPGSILVA